MSVAIPANAPKTRTLKVLHVGVTNRGKWPLEKCDATSGFVPHALCDVTDAALDEARATAGLPASAAFKNVDEAIARGGADCMIVCAPTMLHVPLAKKAIAAKLPVLIEKGMAPTWADAQDLSRTAATRKRLSVLLKTIDTTPSSAQFAPRFTMRIILLTSARCIRSNTHRTVFGRSCGR